MEPETTKKKKPVRLIILLFILVILLWIVSFFLVLAYKAELEYEQNQQAFPPCEWEMCMLIEEHGKVAVAKLDFVQKLVSDYGIEQIEISALGYQFIHDDAYIKRLLGGKYPNIDCIIPVKWPDGEVIYIEVINNWVEEYIQISVEEFEDVISWASEEDIQILYDNMNDNQSYVRQVMKEYKK